MFRRALLSITAAAMIGGFGAAPAVAGNPADLKPVCKQLGFNCGSVIDDADGQRIAKAFGISIGAVLDPADVDRILKIAERVRAAATAKVTQVNSVWDRLAQCESSGNWQSTVGFYEGGLQFHPQTWDAYKPAGYPAAAYQATREQQILVAERVLAAQGWGAWPACSSKLGLR